MSKKKNLPGLVKRFYVTDTGEVQEITVLLHTRSGKAFHIFTNGTAGVVYEIADLFLTKEDALRYSTKLVKGYYIDGYRENTNVRPCRVRVAKSGKKVGFDPKTGNKLWTGQVFITREAAVKVALFDAKMVADKANKNAALANKCLARLKKLLDK